jgi:hypothetical protein
VISTTRVDVFDRAEAQWKEYAGTAILSDLEADRNDGEGKVFGLLPAKLENLKNSMRSAINTDLFGDGTGNGSKDMGGFQSLISTDADHRHVGLAINRANFTFWRNSRPRASRRPPRSTTSAPRCGRSTTSAATAWATPTPSFAVTDRSTFEGFEGLLLANERFTDKSDGDGGFKNEVLKFKGAKLSYDVAAPSGVVYFWNPRFLKLAYKKGSWFKMLEACGREPDPHRVSGPHDVQPDHDQPRRLGCVTAIT